MSATKRDISPEIAPPPRVATEEDTKVVRDVRVVETATTVASPAIWLETVRSPEMRREEVEEEPSMIEEVIDVEVVNATIVASLVTLPRTALPREVREVVREDREVDSVDRVVTETEVRLPVTTVTRVATSLEIALVNRAKDSVVVREEPVVVTRPVTTAMNLDTCPETAPTRIEEAHFFLDE